MLKINRKGKSALQWDKVVDSANKTAFGSGSMRDSQEGKGRYDLIPTGAIHRLAQHYETGAAKYAERNWEKGQPLHQYYNSAMRHLQALRDADLSEDHAAAAVWNIVAMMHHIDAMLIGKLPRDLDSFNIVNAIEQHEKEMSTTQPINTIPATYVRYTPDVKFVASGVMADVDDPFQPLIDYGAEAYDKERFKAGLGVRRFKTTQLTEDE